MGKPSDKKEALTIDVQKKFLDAGVGYSYENQYRFVLQTGLCEILTHGTRCGTRSKWHVAESP